MSRTASSSAEPAAAFPTTGSWPGWNCLACDHAVGPVLQRVSLPATARSQMRPLNAGGALCSEIVLRQERVTTSPLAASELLAILGSGRVCDGTKLPFPCLNQRL